MTRDDINNTHDVDALRARRVIIVRRMTYGLGNRVALIDERDAINARVDALTRDDACTCDDTSCCDACAHDIARARHARMTQHATHDDDARHVRDIDVSHMTRRTRDINDARDDATRRATRVVRRRVTNRRDV